MALMLSKTPQRALMGWQAYDLRIISASFRTKQKRINMNTIQCYAPTNDNNEEQFYSRLQTVIEILSRRNIKIVMGDLNAKVGF
jgi:exonuclease III